MTTQPEALPPLPKPCDYACVIVSVYEGTGFERLGRGRDYSGTAEYSAEQMRDYAIAAISSAPEASNPPASRDAWEILSMASLAESLRKRGDDLSTDAASWLEKLAAPPVVGDAVTGTQREYRRGNFAVDGGGNWYFNEAENGCWLEIDIVGEHQACAYVCVKFEEGDATRFGQAIAGRILKDAPPVAGDAVAHLRGYCVNPADPASFMPEQALASAPSVVGDALLALADRVQALCTEWGDGDEREARDQIANELRALAAPDKGDDHGKWIDTGDSSAPAEGVEVVNHIEAHQLACLNQHDSNLARCYITQAADVAALRTEVDAVALKWSFIAQEQKTARIAAERDAEWLRALLRELQANPAFKHLRSGFQDDVNALIAKKEGQQ